MNGLAEFFAETVFSGELVIAIPLAIIAGLVSFLSPCVLPLVPGFLGYVSGLADTDREDGRRRIVLGTGLFVLGFAVVFVAYGSAFGALGSWLIEWQDALVRLLGVVIILMGLVIVGRITFLQRTLRPSWVPATGLAGAPVLGIVFGLGWTPCIGPTLAAVMSLSLTGGTPWRGALLGFAYCLGIGVPFLLAALGVRWATRAMGFVRRHIRVVNLIGGGILIALGVLMVLGVWGFWIVELQGLVGTYTTIV